MLTTKVNLYHVTKFSPHLLTSTAKINSFTLPLSMRIVLDSFHLFIFYFEKFVT